ncbi:MAG TPA: amidohydrolase family protein [Vicinamibacterales bacterium]|nr:amidohydrolase family protein [Vicinamibacterales bacterium]
MRSVLRPTLAACAALTAACSGGPRPAADLIVTHARIWTGDPAQPEASAFAVFGDRIVDVGSVRAIDAWRGENTRVVDAEGRRVVPGFNDAHVHVADAGTALEQIDLTDAADAAEILRRISERARAAPGEWIAGGRWNSALPPDALPARAAIDDATNGTPVFVTDAAGRRALVNAAALGRAGITEQTPDPPDGRIVRDARGFPTGIVEGTALALVDRAIPRPTPADRLRIIKRALERAASAGVTSLQDFGASGDDVAAYAELANLGELTARVYAVPNESGWYDQAKLGVRRSFGSAWLRLGAVAGGVRAAGDDPHETDLLRTRLMAADHAGLQVCFLAADAHDVTAALDRVDDIVRADGARDRRTRIERAGFAAAADGKRFVPLQVVASLQSAAGADIFDVFAGEGARIAIGSGWPEASIDPMQRLHALGAHGRIADALRAYTSGSAFAEFQDGEKGKLSRGQRADAVVLSDDLLASAARVEHAQALVTIAGGKVVHQRRP